ncbi:MAG: tRNA 4-thiouridine(8) synthase ThiI [Methanomassiliicoccaceae archaeon]|nr:tRNA 4-thiouridine(8) synthase ThiI [Methanomassiliicoccaceae archaeon]MCL2146048.1 tRNA 4-thiouridine(8) synthase ThiI [Methanomassiliicoccaceae archaeon]
MKLLALISGGIDSPVAAYLMDRIGADVILLHMDNRPFADDVSIEKIGELAERLRAVTGSPFPLYSAPHGISQERISKTCDRNYQCVLCKRTMLRTAQELSSRLGCGGIVMGDSLGQVASQTLKNLRYVSSGLKMPVVRPLIGYDKIEIEAVAKEIGTYDISIKRSVGCSIVPSKPVTEADLNKMAGFDVSSGIDELVSNAAENTIRLS